ncbi:MAG: site-specific integrase [Deltaproteobacteria bacterium]|nr:site-specific integrase [Deltaproteobacteria bacterium]
MAKLKPARVVKTKYNTYALHFYSPNGRRRRLTVGSDPQMAQRLSMKFTDWLLEGKDPEVELEQAKKKGQVKAITLRDFYPTFMKNHGVHQSRSMQELYRYSFKNLSRCKELVDVPMVSISKRLMLEYMNARVEQDGVKAATVNREAAFVKGMLSRAVEWGFLNSNPLQGLRLFKEADKREVDITPEQIKSLVKKLPDQLGDIVEFAVYTGFRKENILGLRIEDIQFDDANGNGRAVLVVKGGRREFFPLGNLAVRVLKRAIGKRTAGYVFINPRTGDRYRSINKSFDRAVRKLGLLVNGTKLRFHDLRHVFATWLHKEGVTLDVLRSLLGHRQRATTDRYTSFDRMSFGKMLDLMPEISEQDKVASDA